MAQTARQLGYTWEEYRQWPDDERWEIINGEAFNMSPAPSPRHQMIASRLTSKMDGFFQVKKCRVLSSPIDIKLSEEDIVQPDLVVVCDPAQIKSTHIEGAPALAVEILSPSTSIHDRNRKRALYARAGVREYWIVTPFPSLVEILLLRDKQYVIAAAYEKSETLQSPTFPDLRIALGEVFDFPLEPGEEPPKTVREPPPHCAP
jgi:Uma2 family endonuclease